MMPKVFLGTRLTSTQFFNSFCQDTTCCLIFRSVADGSSKIIDSEKVVGGYPDASLTRQKFDEKAWDLETMMRR